MAVNEYIEEAKECPNCHKKRMFFKLLIVRVHVTESFITKLGVHCNNCGYEAEVTQVAHLELEVKGIEPVEGTYMLEGHYHCSHCHKMLGFPDPDRKMKGIFVWNREGIEVRPAPKHICSTREAQEDV